MATNLGTPNAAPTRLASPGWNLYLGLIVASVALSIFAPLYLADFAPSRELPLAVILAIPSLVLAALAAWRGRPWMYLAAGLTAPLFAILVLVVFGALSAVVSGTASELGTSVMLVGVLALAVPSGIAAFRAARGALVAPARFAVYAAVLLGLVGGAAYAGTVFRAAETAGASAYDVTPEATTTIAISDFEFGAATLPSGKLVEIALENADPISHTFTYDRDGRTFHHVLPGLTTTKVLVKFDGAGEIAYKCLPHEGMAGKLTVE